MSTEVSRSDRFTPVLEHVKALLPPLTRFAVDLHQHPEESGDEARTSSSLADALEDSGFTVTRGVGGHGVVGVLTNGDGPRVMLRAELDALPVPERTGLPYAASGPLSHSCGHDLHTAAVLGAATLLARSREHWRGTLLVVGQPAEETLTGARALLQDGLYSRFGPPDVVLAQHSAPLLAGMVAHAYPGGPVLAASAEVNVTLHGRGGHAGAPHMAADPVLAAAAVIQRLQGVVSRECAPAEQVALTVGTVHAGSRSNVIPDSARLGISVRALSRPAVDRVLLAVDRVVRGEAAASGCPRPPEIATVGRSVATVPDAAVSAEVSAAHREAFGAERVALWPPSMATEDVALFGEAGREIHGCGGIALGYWMFGVVGPRQWASTSGATTADRLAGLPPNHSPEFAPHLPIALPAATEAMAVAALCQLRGGAGPSAAPPE
ncbi:amidohydrolase [Streptomyces fructofermentans]|uniref:amidohydrolase n=1 Tax=Streptomyces fructofermentans TaxID=152141 RepID=UPI0033CCDA98